MAPAAGAEMAAWWLDVVRPVLDDPVFIDAVARQRTAHMPTFFSHAIALGGQSDDVFEGHRHAR